MNSAPSFAHRVWSVWKRHQRTYFKNLVANGLPPFLEPLIFLMALGIGLGQYVTEMEGMSFVAFIAPAMMAMSAFYTAAFETTYGTFVRMEYQKTYQNMLATPVTFREIYLGELLWCGTKGLMFSACVLLVIAVFGLVKYPLVLLAPVVGFLTALVFGVVGYFVTGFVKNMSNFNLFFTGILTPMFYFSGTFFPLNQLPKVFQVIGQFVPLTHSVILMRTLARNQFEIGHLYNLFMLIVLPLPLLFVSYRMIKRRLIL